MEIFWNTIAAYNAATWPAQIVFTGIATLLLLLLCLRPTNTVRIAMIIPNMSEIPSRIIIL